MQQNVSLKLCPTTLLMLLLFVLLSLTYWEEDKLLYSKTHPKHLSPTRAGEQSDAIAINQIQC